MCAYTTKYLEFQFEKAGGGFMGELSADDPDIRKTERNGSAEMLPSGNELVRSAQFLVLGVDSGVTTQMICDMKKTQMKVAKQWNTRRAGLRSCTRKRVVQSTYVVGALEVNLDLRSPTTKVRGSTTL